MKKHISTVLLFGILVIGIGLLVYPSFSNWWNSNMATHVIADYNQAVTHTDGAEIDRMWEEARAFNESLNGNYQLNEEQIERYNQCFDALNGGVMGYVEIPSIRVSLPIYHGTDETVLQVGIGHLEWSSLPTGDLGNHVVISGHRGLPSARLFTDIDQLVVGDTFTLNILDKEFTYEVDQIHIVLPSELSDLRPEADREYCTLVTCTPYGVNSHRLLVRGHRVASQNNDRVMADALQVDTVIVALVIAAVMLFVLLVVFLFATRKKKKRIKKLQIEYTDEL